MSEYELLASIKFDLTRAKAYKFTKERQYGETIISTKGTKEARRKASRYFEVRPEHIVHHKDYDETNNKLSNLSVFKSTKDHVRHHGKFSASEPVWDGAKEDQTYDK